MKSISSRIDGEPLKAESRTKRISWIDLKATLGWKTCSKTHFADIFQSKME